MNAQDFYRKMSRYTPGDRARKTLEGLTDYKMRVDKERRFVEIDMSFDEIVPKEALYNVEDEIKRQYELESVRILPKYASSAFYFEYIHEVVKEAYRIGFVTRGFFENYSASQNGDEILIALGVSESGARLVCEANTGEVMEGIIRSEFGISKKVVIRGNGERFDTESYFGRQKKELDGIYDRDVLSAKREKAERERIEKERKAEEEAARPKMISHLSSDEVSFSVGDELCTVGSKCTCIFTCNKHLGKNIADFPSVALVCNKAVKFDIIANGNLILCTDKVAVHKSQSTALTDHASDIAVACYIQCIRPAFGNSTLVCITDKTADIVTICLQQNAICIRAGNTCSSVQQTNKTACFNCAGRRTSNSNIFTAAVDHI